MGWADAQYSNHGVAHDTLPMLTTVSRHCDYALINQQSLYDTSQYLCI